MCSIVIIETGLILGKTEGKSADEADVGRNQGSDLGIVGKAPALTGRGKGQFGDSLYISSKQ